MIGSVPPPLQDSVIELDERDPERKNPFYLSKAYARWFDESLLPATQAAVQINKTTSLNDQAAAIGATTAFQTAGAGVFRCNYAVRVSQTATVNSSVQVTINWITSGVSLNVTGAALVGNLTTTSERQTILMRVDGLSDITFAVAYVSVGATPMKFELDVVVEALG